MAKCPDCYDTCQVITGHEQIFGRFVPVYAPCRNKCHEKQRPRIIIEVSGGLIQGVYGIGLDEPVDVFVVDDDTDGAMDKDAITKYDGKEYYVCEPELCTLVPQYLPKIVEAFEGQPKRQ